MINVAYLIKKIIKIIGAFPLASLGVGLVPGSAFASVLRCTSLSKIDPISEYSSQRSFQLVPPSAPSKSLTQQNRIRGFGSWVWVLGLGLGLGIGFWVWVLGFELEVYCSEKVWKIEIANSSFIVICKTLVF